MTPLQLAAQECANHDRGTCHGVHIGDRGEITYCSPKPRCILGGDARCGYFEECVAPMASMVTDTRRAVEIQAALQEYRKQTRQREPIARKCPDCGGAVLWRKRFCPVCAGKRRKATYREHKRATRQNGVDLSTVKPKVPPKTLGNSHGFSDLSRNPYQGSGCQGNNHLTVDMTACGADRPGRGDES